MDLVRSLLVIGLLIMGHELGHFLAARLFRVGVLEFSIGFGPLLAKVKRGSTQYSIRAVPLGGFCKLAGMEMMIEGEPVEETPPGTFSFASLPPWKRALILLAGPASNLIMAAITFIIMFGTIGIPSGVDERAIIGNIEPKMPAYEAGLSAGDLIVAVDDREIGSWQELVEAIRNSGGRQVTVTAIRGERTIVRSLKPIYDPGTKTYMVGIIARQLYERVSFASALSLGFRSVYEASIGIVDMLIKAASGKARISLSGPVGAIDAVSLQYRAGPWWFLYMIATFNLFLALFNLLPVPIPLLDGGWIVIYLLEAILRREFTEREKASAQILGLVILATFFVFVTYGDILSKMRRFINR